MRIGDRLRPLIYLDRAYRVLVTRRGGLPEKE